MPDTPEKHGMAETTARWLLASLSGIAVILTGVIWWAATSDANFANLSDFWVNPDRIMVNHELIINSTIGNRAMTGNSANTPNPAAMPIVEARFEFEVMNATMVTGLVT